jgi:hypothetical protein
MTYVVPFYIHWYAMPNLELLYSTVHLDMLNMNTLGEGFSRTVKNLS